MHDELIRKTEDFVKKELAADSSGHDWWHIHRVRGLAVRIAREEQADPFICEMAALLHDVADEKLNPTKEIGMAKVLDWLTANEVDAAAADHIMTIIGTMSYNGGHNPPMTTLEGRVVQDADRLDAIGAIGIARTFAYGGAKGRLMHDPETTPSDYVSPEAYRSANGSSVNHFYEKLLKLKDRMNTSYGSALAGERHRYMEAFLERFYAEWDARDGE